MAALRLRQLGLRGRDPRHRLLEVLRARRRRERARPGRFLVGALGDDLHGDRRRGLPAPRRHRRPRRGPEALPGAPDLSLGRRDGSDGHGQAGRRRVGPRPRRRRNGRLRGRNRLLQRVSPRSGRRLVAGPAVRLRFATGYAGSALALAAALPFALARLVRRRLPRRRRRSSGSSRCPPCSSCLRTGPGRSRSARPCGSAFTEARQTLRQIVRTPEPPRLPPRLSLLRGRHQHRGVLLVDLRGPHPRLHDRGGDRPLLRRPALGPGRRVALGAPDRHLGAEAPW